MARKSKKSGYNVKKGYHGQRIKTNYSLRTEAVLYNLKKRNTKGNFKRLSRNLGRFRDPRNLLYLNQFIKEDLIDNKKHKLLNKYDNYISFYKSEDYIKYRREVCKRRKERRRMLFALNLTKKGKGGIKNITFDSSIIC